MSLSQVKKNVFGFYEVVAKPTQEELQKYYAEKYYQEPLNSTSYSKQYSKEELTYIRNKLEQKYILASDYLPRTGQKFGFLDVGAGEGWALAYFIEKDFVVSGLDYSDYGCKTHNPVCLDKMITGDIYINLDKLIEKTKTFDLILLDNVLEHVLDPLALLVKLRNLLNQRGVLIIEVPNDFSIAHHHLLENSYISRPFWIMMPDHLSYFNRDGLISICHKAGWTMRDMIGDFPIDFSLFNRNTNYVDKKETGKSCHAMRIVIENLLHSISPDKTNSLYRALCDLGLGRQLIGFFQKADNKT